MSKRTKLKIPYLIAVSSRVSSPDQEDDLDIQEDDNLEYAGTLHGEVVKTVRETVRGLGKARPEFEALMNAIFRREVTLVVYKDISRFSREGPQAIEELELILEYGCEVHFWKQELVLTCVEDTTKKVWDLFAAALQNWKNRSAAQKGRDKTGGRKVKVNKKLVIKILAKCKRHSRSHAKQCKIEGANLSQFYTIKKQSNL